MASCVYDAETKERRRLYWRRTRPTLALSSLATSREAQPLRLEVKYQKMRINVSEIRTRDFHQEVGHQHWCIDRGVIANSNGDYLYKLMEFQTHQMY